MTKLTLEHRCRDSISVTVHAVLHCRMGTVHTCSCKTIEPRHKKTCLDPVRLKLAAQLQKLARGLKFQI